MNARTQSTRVRWLAVAGALVLFGAMLSGPAAMKAQQPHGEDYVFVSAGVGAASVYLGVCDWTANFGYELTSAGATPTMTDDLVVPTTPGDPEQGQGVFYVWYPSCPGPLLNFNANVPFTLTSSATPNEGTSNLVGAGDFSDLSHDYMPESSYAGADFWGREFQLYPPTTLGNIGTFPAGAFTYPIYLYLRVDPDAAPGTFGNVAVWQIDMFIAGESVVGAPMQTGR